MRRTQVLLAGACVLVAAAAIGAGAVMAAADPAPSGPAISTIAPLPATPPVVAPPSTTAALPTTEEPASNEPSTTSRRAPRPAATRTPPSWSEDNAAEAERRLRQLQDSGPDSSLTKCLQSGKLYEQCSG